MTTHHVCLSSSLACSRLNGCRNCRDLYRSHVTVPAMAAANLSNAQAETFLAASEAALVELHTQMRADPVVAENALDLNRLYAAIGAAGIRLEDFRAGAIARAAQAAQVSDAARGVTSPGPDIMDPGAAQTYMEGVTRRVATNGPVHGASGEAARVRRQSDPAPAVSTGPGPQEAEHAAALVAREILANPGLLQAILASGIASAQAAAQQQPQQQDEAASEVEVPSAMDASSAYPTDVVEAAVEAAPAATAAVPVKAAPSERDQRIASLVEPMDAEDIAAAGEAIDDTFLSEPQPAGETEGSDLNGSASLGLTNEPESDSAMATHVDE